MCLCKNHTPPNPSPQGPQQRNPLLITARVMVCLQRCFVFSFLFLFLFLLFFLLFLFLIVIFIVAMRDFLRCLGEEVGRFDLTDGAGQLMPLVVRIFKIH